MKANTRRTVSLRAQTYVRLRKHAWRMGMSSAGIVEQAITAWLDSNGEPTVDRMDALAELGVLPARNHCEPPWPFAWLCENPGCEIWNDGGVGGCEACGDPRPAEIGGAA